ncbi:hypothetical protein BK025_16370 [Sodalis sp. TME1]|nr:hypothetical protein BK025_16370 [Sodalis sp. TME1]
MYRVTPPNALTAVARRPRVQIFASAKKRVEWEHAKVVHSCYSVNTQHCKEFNVSAKQGN